MTKPMIDLSKDWQQPTSIKEDQRFAGYPWRVFTPGSFISREEFLYRGDSHAVGMWGETIKAPSTMTRYVKIPESLVRSSNVAVIHEAAAMFVAHDEIPAYAKPASYKNPKIYNYYRWTPLSFHHDGEWLSLSEYTRRIMPKPPRAAEIAPKPPELIDFKARREWVRTGKAEGVKYICTCGRRHVRTVYMGRGEKPPERCPSGALMRVGG